MCKKVASSAWIDLTNYGLYCSPPSEQTAHGGHFCQLELDVEVELIFHPSIVQFIVRGNLMTQPHFEEKNGCYVGTITFCYDDAS